MDIYLHGFPTRFILFTNKLIEELALQNTNMDSRDYIIGIKIWQVPTDLRFKKDKCPVMPFLVPLLLGMVVEGEEGKRSAWAGAQPTPLGLQER